MPTEWWDKDELESWQEGTHVELKPTLGHQDTNISSGHTQTVLDSHLALEPIHTQHAPHNQAKDPKTSENSAQTPQIPQIPQISLKLFGLANIPQTPQIAQAHSTTRVWT